MGGNSQTNHYSLTTSHCFSGADVAQLVEHVLGKDGVSGSIPLIGSRVLQLRGLSWDWREAV